MSTSKFYVSSVLVRGVSNAMTADALRLDPNAPAVNMQKAIEQHNCYVKMFRDMLGLSVINVPADHKLPDCVFVEDPLVVIEKKALFTTLGHPSRMPEKKDLLAVVQGIKGIDIFDMEDIDPSARLDGGDVLYTGEEILVGRSSRTNDAGIEVLAKVFSFLPVTPIPVSNTLHLKSVCSLAGPSTILVGVGTKAGSDIMKKIKLLAKGQYKYIEVQGHSYGSNAIYMETDKGSVLIHPPSTLYPESEEVYKSIHVDVKIPLDLSEFAKVDGCLTCNSVLLSV